MRSSYRSGLAVAIAIGIWACSDSAGPVDPSSPGDSRPPTSLNIVHHSGIAPEVDTAVSFYAVRGSGREAALFYRTATGERGEEFVRLKLDQASLLARPDGSPVAEGDSVLITMRVVDPTLLLVEFAPAGLQFSPAHPAELEMRYLEADNDFNEDGLHDSTDNAIERALGIWRQETPGQPFVRLSSALTTADRSVRSSITGFTRYALAY